MNTVFYRRPETVFFTNMLENQEDLQRVINQANRLPPKENDDKFTPSFEFACTEDFYREYLLNIGEHRDIVFSGKEIILKNNDKGYQISFEETYAKEIYYKKGGYSFICGKEAEEVEILEHKIHKAKRFLKKKTKEEQEIIEKEEKEIIEKYNLIELKSKTVYIFTVTKEIKEDYYFVPSYAE